MTVIGLYVVIFHCNTDMNNFVRIKYIGLLSVLFMLRFHYIKS